MYSSRNIDEYIDISNIVAKNELDSNSPLSPQPPHIKTPLKLHQLTVLYSMKQNEISYPTGACVPTGEQCYSTFGIVGDRVGVGKTLMVLGHISQMAYEPLRTEHSNKLLHPQSTPSFYSTYTPTYTPFDTLVIVPHSLFKQWYDAITTQTTLRCHLLKTAKDLDKENLIKDMRESHLTLISNTLLSSLLITLLAKKETPVWRRVIYDEADTIKIPSTCSLPIARLTWFVTASYNNLLFVNRYFHIFHLNQLTCEMQPAVTLLVESLKKSSQTIVFYKTVSFPFFKPLLETSHPLRAHTVIKNSDAFLDMSIELPPCHRNTLICHAPIQQQIVQNLLPTEVLQMLHAGDVQGALQGLGVPARTNATLAEAVTSFKQRELARLKRRLIFKEGEEYDTVVEREGALAPLRKKIEVCEKEICSIQKRIEEVSKGSCAICFEVPKNSCVPPCCARPFCGECILTWMSLNTNCPLCRAELHSSQLVTLSQTDRPGGTQPLSKHQTVLHLLEDNPDGFFLIFSRYDNPFVAIQKEVEESLSYTTASLQGNKDVIGKILHDFEKKTIKVLFLNSKTMGAGMNLQTATHVILLHKMMDEEEKQILGRAYRMGRREPLHVYQLLHERE